MRDLIKETCRTEQPTEDAGLVSGHSGALRDEAQKSGGPSLHRGTPQRHLRAYLESGKKDSEASFTKEECASAALASLSCSARLRCNKRPGGTQS